MRTTDPQLWERIFIMALYLIHWFVGALGHVPFPLVYKSSEELLFQRRKACFLA